MGVPLRRKRVSWHASGPGSIATDMRTSSDPFSECNRYSLRLLCQLSTFSASNHFLTLLQSFSFRYTDINSSYIVYIIAMSQQTVELYCSWRKAPGEDLYSKLSVPRDVPLYNCRSRVILSMDGGGGAGEACCRLYAKGINWLFFDCQYAMDQEGLYW